MAIGAAPFRGATGSRTAASLWAASTALAQEAAQKDSTFSTGVKVVNVLATVRNSKGEIVRDLMKDDFVLEEDMHPETIRYFARETDLPLTLGLLVDVSQSQRRVLGDERRASTTFLNQVLREDKDRGFLIQFERDVELIKDLTSSRKDLEAGVNSLDAPELKRPGDDSGSRSDGGGRRGGGRGGGGTSLYDAVYLASDEILKEGNRAQGRDRAIGRRRSFEQDHSDGRDRVGATCRYAGLLYFFRRRSGVKGRQLRSRIRRGRHGPRRRTAQPDAPGIPARRQENSRAPFQRNRRNVFRSVEKASARRHLQAD